MIKVKGKRGTAAETTVTLVQSSSNELEAILDIEGGPPCLSGSSPHLNSAAYRAGRDALDRLSSGREFADWILVAHGVSAARAEAMAIAATNNTNSKLYRNAFSFVLKREGLDTDKLDSKTRGELFKIIEHLPEIEAFLEQLDDNKRRTLNHPSAILRNWEKTRRTPPVERKTHAAALREENVELQRQVDQLTKRAAELEQERNQLKREAEPQFVEPSLALTALLRLGDLDVLVDELLAAPPNFKPKDLIAFAVRIEQLADALERQVTKAEDELR